MRKLLIATRNPAKLEEFKMFLKDLPIEVVGLKDLGVDDSFEESGKTFAENARAKALFFFKKTGLPTLADDGGIEDELTTEETQKYNHRAKALKKLRRVIKSRILR